MADFRMGSFYPDNPTKEWNKGKGTQLVCPDCKEDSLMFCKYPNDDFLVDCNNCGAQWRVAFADAPVKV